MSLAVKNQERESYAQGWLESNPLERYSSLHELSFWELMGIKSSFLKKNFFVQFSFNLHTPLILQPNAYLTFHTRDTDKDSAGKYCYTVSNFMRWRVNIAPYRTFEEFINSRIRWNRCNYAKSQKVFNEYGCEVTLLTDDWSKHADVAYQLYENVARRHGDKLYDIHFFREAAKRKDYPLLCAWYQGQMIAHFLLVDEEPTLHSTCCGMDYQHSSKSYAYSWMHYELIRSAIESGKYQSVDVGLTADECKKSIGFEPVISSMDIYSNGLVTRNTLKLASMISHATITPAAKLKFGFGRGV